MKTFGDRIREARNAKHLTQKDLADLVGISQPTLHELESGKSKKTSFILELAEALDVSPYWLLHGKEPRKGPRKKGSK